MEVQSADHKTLYENVLKSLSTINNLSIELHKAVMEIHPEIIIEFRTLVATATSTGRCTLKLKLCPPLYPVLAS